MRLLYLPNEVIDGDQVGPRHSLSLLLQNGDLDQVTTFSFLVEEKKLGDWSLVLEKLFGLIKDTLPDLILVQHIGKNQITKADVNKIKDFYDGPPPIIAYDERDVYGYIRKPLPSSVLEFARNCDAVFLVAAGNFADRFRKAGCKNVYYLPHVASDVTFGKPWIPSMERKYDVIMIGHRVSSRISLLEMPGVKEREELARKLSIKFGERFAIFGNGWEEYPNSKGPVNFVDQEKIARQSWISLGHDHFYNLEGYFSNRLPIALFSGVPYICRKTPGLENILTDGHHCRFFNSIDEGVQICEELLQMPKEELIKLGMRGSIFAKKYLNEDVRMARLVELLKEIKFSTTTKAKT